MSLILTFRLTKTRMSIETSSPKVGHQVGKLGRPDNWSKIKHDAGIPIFVANSRVRGISDNLGAE